MLQMITKLKKPYFSADLGKGKMAAEKLYSEFTVGWIFDDEVSLIE